MRTKLVTAYYSYREGPPVWGKQNRERWYKYSLGSICRTNVPIVCYTDLGQSYEALSEHKEQLHLDNLTIKPYDIAQSPFHERIYNIRMQHAELYNNEFHPFYRMPFSIYWNKWNFLQMEYEPDTYLYWIDGGLSTEAVLPRRANSYSIEPDYDMHYAGDPSQEYKIFVFDKVFTPELFDRINTYTGDKILNLCRRGTTDNDFATMQEKLGVPIYDNIYQIDLFPVASLFGGNTPLLLTYIDAFNTLAERILSLGNYLCTEQELMGYVHTYNREWFTDWIFNDFYHEDWKIYIDGEKVPYRDHFPNNIAFSQFFLDNPIQFIDKR